MLKYFYGKRFLDKFWSGANIRRTHCFYTAECLSNFANIGFHAAKNGPSKVPPPFPAAEKTHLLRLQIGPPKLLRSRSADVSEDDQRAEKEATSVLSVVDNVDYGLGPLKQKVLDSR